jgi:hypothetical protein
VRGHIEVKHFPPVMGHNEKNIENAECDCRDGEEINRGKLFAVVFQKGTPCLGGRFGMSDHIFGDSCLGDIDSEFEQFAMNSRGAPERIFFADLSDQLANLSWNRRSSGTSPALPSPKQAKTLAVPCNHCFWFDNDQGRALDWPDTREPNPKHSVPRPESWPAGDRTSQDVDLVAEGNDLDLKLMPCSQTEDDVGE